ncbi:alpha/beta hydrolase [Tautonia sociabilis]|uniref:Alpha/beta hydrolase n=1 Tax=Tautonia sociabilis TaxID=2080755 RepID=A0A432MJZ0_9BACT|nr:alpha/beta hydrolase [Tautonia sociabilis]RUL87723.1 alpha/beta hydrolase [Tautonia sociabilis]
MPPIPDPAVVSPEGVAIPVEGRRPILAWHWSSPAPRGVLVIAHGLGEHGGLYRSFAEYLVPATGVEVLAIDFTGHGRSPGRRGHVDRYDRLVDDLLSALRWASRTRPGLPRCVLGHSNGGVVAALALLREPRAAGGLILSNPAFRLKYRPPRHKLAVGHLLRIVAPWITLGGPLPVESLTRDPLYQVLLRTDSLMHSRIGAPLFFGMRDGGRLALDRAEELTLPLLLVIGADDPIIDPDSGRAFFQRFGGREKTALDLPGVLHDPLFDQERGRVYRALADWLAALVSAAVGAEARGVSLPISGLGRS